MRTENHATAVLRLVPAIIIAVLAFMPGVAQETNPVKLVKGIVTDAASGRPVDGGMIFAFEGSSTDPAVRSRINPKTGAYQLILSPSVRYRFRIEAASYYATDIPFTSPSGNEYQESEKNFSVRPLPIGTSLLSGQIFAAGSDQVKTTTELRKAAEFIKAQPYMAVSIMVAGDPPAAAKKGKGGASSSAGPPPSASPATGRANALRGYLTGLGINLERVTISTVPKITAAIAKKKGVRPSDNVAIVITGVDHDIRR
jgi:hypothetical protein